MVDTQTTESATLKTWDPNYNNQTIKCAWQDGRLGCARGPGNTDGTGARTLLSKTHLLIMLQITVLEKIQIGFKNSSSSSQPLHLFSGREPRFY